MTRRTLTSVVVAGVAAASLCAAGVLAAAGQQSPPPAKPQVSAKAEEHLEVGPPPFTDGIFPCTACHKDLKVNRTRRVLTDMHTEIDFSHDAEHRWCLDCHDATDRDHLHLASGELVPFDESYRLCGQCHGEKFRDWRAGIHGRRTGEWNGRKKYLLCASCHNPHQPRFKPIVPKPAPVRPSGPAK
ncbi:MAG: hypothetical protein WCP29_11800 [Acidobacteriota bacterium]